MKLLSQITLNGHVGVSTFAARLRAVADSAEAEAAAMTALGGASPRIESGNDLVFQFTVVADKA